MGILRRVRDVVSGGRTHLSAGDAAPSWDVAAVPGGMTHLEDLRGRWVVLYFFPRADTPGCTRESCALRDEKQLLPLAAVYGASTDTVDAQTAFRGKYALPFPLLADADGAMAKRYGVLTRGILPEARRVTFLIDPTGTVRQVLRDVDVSRHGAQVLEALQALGA